MPPHHFHTLPLFSSTQFLHLTPHLACSYWPRRTPHPPHGKLLLVKGDTSFSLLQLSPSQLFNCNSFTNPKIYKYPSFSISFPFFSLLHFTKRKASTIFSIPSNSLDRGSSPSSSGVSPWIISDHDPFKLHMTDLCEYSYSPRLV